jgi:hypothetical protein
MYVHWPALRAGVLAVAGGTVVGCGEAGSVYVTEIGVGVGVGAVEQPLIRNINPSKSNWLR